MIAPDPMEHAWWLGSRAAGIVALLAMAAAVGLGLALAARVTRDPGRIRLLAGLHQHAALTALVAIAVHGIALLGDPFLSPGIADVTVPFVMERERLWTGLGATGGWIAAILGLSYWLRHRLGPARWRALHRLTTVAYLLSVAHTLGAGTDAGEPWMQVLVVASGAPVLFLLVLRLLPPPPVVTPGFRRMRVAATTPESPAVCSLRLEPADGKPLPVAAPGQFVPVRVPIGGEVLQRSYSLSSATGHRLGVARDGRVSTALHGVRVGDVLEVGAPAGAFVLDPDPSRAVVLLGAGVGVTPLLAMLEALALAGSPRPVWWVQVARSAAELPFADEVAALASRLPRVSVHVHLTAERGRPGAEDVLALGMPRDAAFHLCGSAPFVAALEEGLRERGVTHLRAEAFGGGAPEAAPQVTFRRTGVTTAWDPALGSLQELADRHGVRSGASCRMGACEGCRTRVVAGDVQGSRPGALAGGTALLCCARPGGDVVLDA